MNDRGGNVQVSKGGRCCVALGAQSPAEHTWVIVSGGHPAGQRGDWCHAQPTAYQGCCVSQRLPDVGTGVQTQALHTKLHPQLFI